MITHWLVTSFPLIQPLWRMPLATRQSSMIRQPNATKLILNPTLVGTERNNERAKLIDAFMEDYVDFTNKRGMFACDSICIIAADEHAMAYQ